MVQARDDGLIGGVGLSNVSRDHLRYALGKTDIACVQNLMNLADRRSMPVLEECHARGIAFVPFFPLGSGFAAGNPVLASPQVTDTAARLGFKEAQVALAWLLDLRPEVLLIPGTASMRHLEENLAVADPLWTKKHASCWPRWHKQVRSGRTLPVMGRGGAAGAQTSRASG